jgi:UDP:flavonoid glycosyltransferase YjiC (YdhE family)
MKCKTILVTWEIGQGLGHVFPILPIARELKTQGHRVLFALRDVRGVGVMLQREGFGVLQAPFHPDRFFPANGPQPQTMADILGIFGFASVRDLSGLVAAWNGLFGLCKPDVVVASYAPLSLLCARAAGIPSVLTALPFEMPAKVHPSPVFRTGKAPIDGQMDDRVINAVNTVFQRALLDAIHAVFIADKSFLMSFEELDPFGPRAEVMYCGNIFVNDTGEHPSWPTVARFGKVFGYLNADLPALEQLRQEIHASKHDFSIVIRGADELLLNRWKAPNVQVTTQAIRLDIALKECDVVLSYGGAGFVSACLLAGKPMVFYVNQLEQLLNAQQVVKVGAGMHPQPQTPKGTMEALDCSLTNLALHTSAQRFAKKYESHDPKAVAKQVAAEVQILCK